MRSLRQALLLLLMLPLLSVLGGSSSAEDAFDMQSTEWELTVAFEDDVEKKTFDEWKDRIEKASELLYRLTEGQIFIAKCTLHDKTSCGNFIVLTGLADKEVIPEADAMAQTFCKGTPFWYVLSAGIPDGFPGGLWTKGTVVVHELGHAVFNRPDERGEGIECPNCIMGTDPAKLCDAKTHRGNIPKSCKDAISEAYKGKVKFPDPRFRTSMRVPLTKFTIVDRGAKDLSPELARLTEAEKKGTQKYEELGRAISLDVSFQGNANNTQLLRWKRYVLCIDRILRYITGGQFFISKCKIEDKKTEGAIVIEEGAEDESVLKSDTSAMWKNTGKGWLSAGMIPPEGLARYMLADMLKITENNKECEDCFLNLGVWREVIPYSLCDEKTHKGEGRPCAQQLVDFWKSKGVTAPAKAQKEKNLPITRFEIVDH